MLCFNVKLMRDTPSSPLWNVFSGQLRRTLQFPLQGGEDRGVSCSCATLPLVPPTAGFVWPLPALSSSGATELLDSRTTLCRSPSSPWPQRTPTLGLEQLQVDRVELEPVPGRLLPEGMAVASHSWPLLVAFCDVLLDPLGAEAWTAWQTNNWDIRFHGNNWSGVGGGNNRYYSAQWGGCKRVLHNAWVLVSSRCEVRERSQGRVCRADGGVSFTFRGRHQHLHSEEDGAKQVAGSEAGPHLHGGSDEAPRCDLFMRGKEEVRLPRMEIVTLESWQKTDRGTRVGGKTFQDPSPSAVTEVGSNTWNVGLIGDCVYAPPAQR